MVLKSIDYLNIGHIWTINNSRFSLSNIFSIISSFKIESILFKSKILNSEQKEKKLYIIFILSKLFLYT